MIKTTYKKLQLLLCCLFFCSIGYTSWGQANIQVRVTSIEVLNNQDCDNVLFNITGDSDFMWEYKVTDNTIGRTNNNANLISGGEISSLFSAQANYALVSGNNGPYVRTTPNNSIFEPGNGIFFDWDYVCPTDVPTSLNFEWAAYEADEPIFGSGITVLSKDANTGIINQTLSVPASGVSAPQTFTTSASNGNCSQTYTITVEVTRTNLVINNWEDNICNASQIVVGTSDTRAWCPNCTLEPNEPHQGDVSNNRSRWFYFIAPPSGEVDISTDNGNTDFGTYIEIYHAADGVGCTSGLQPVSGTLIKDKFEYLSHINNADLGGFANIQGEADITFTACDPVSGFSNQKLHPGEAYYVQLTTDDANERGYIEVSVSDLGGSSPPDIEDIPCTAPTTSFGTTPISSSAGSPATINLNFGCALDGGNDNGETGAAHTNNNPDNYHAYDYDHPAVNNNTMNESVWFKFTAPNSGRIVFETDYQSGIYSEGSAFFANDARFAPGVPSDYSCANLTNVSAADGGLNGLLGGAAESAIIMEQCLEPGYTYYGMVDPANNLTLINSQDIDVWLHDPSTSDPANNPPPNDILCLSMLDTLFEVPVKPANQTIPFSAVAGDNTNACIETLAGEPFSNPNPAARADQTVWHYFTVPPSGVVEIKLRAYVGLDSLNYAIYPLFQDSLCYGGLQPATYTTDGTQATPQITAEFSGTTGFNGDIIGLCCLTPGTVYAIQLDGGHPGDEGQYIIEYINEIEVYAGDAQYSVLGDTVNFMASDTGFVCFGDTLFPSVMVDGNGVSTTNIANCLDIGYIVQDSVNIPDSIINGNFTFIDSVYARPHYWVNDGTHPFSQNAVHYVGPMADETATWGSLTCPSASSENGAPFVFLSEIILTTNYNSNNCIIDFSATGGFPSYNGSLFDYWITNTAGDTVLMGQTAVGLTNQYAIPVADTFTIVITDGMGCNQTAIVDATPCLDPCVNNPVFVTPDPIDSSVYTCYPGGDSALVTIFLNGGAPSTTVGEAYTATVSGSTTPNGNGVYTTTGTGAPSATPFSFSVMDGDTWMVIVLDSNGCPDTTSGTFDYNLMNCPDYCALNPITSTFSYNCNMDGTALVQITVNGGQPTIDGSNYTVNISGSTVFGQNFQNAQLNGVIGGAANFSFLVNDSDTWTFDVFDINMCADTLTDIYTFDTSNCPICTMMPVQILPDPVDSSVYTCSSNGDAVVTLFITGGAPSFNGGQFTVTTTGSSIAGQNGTTQENVGIYRFNIADGDTWSVVVSDENGCADTATGSFNYNPLDLAVNVEPYVCFTDKTADVTIRLSGGEPAANGSNYLVTIIGASTLGASGYQIPVLGTIGDTTDYTFNVQDGDNWLVVVTDNSQCGVDSISGHFLWNATNCGDICNDPNYVGVSINNGSGLYNYSCDSIGNATLNLQITGGMPALTAGNDDYIANVTINGVTNAYLVNSNGNFGTLTLNLTNGDAWSVMVFDALQCDTAMLSATFTSVNAVANAITPPGMLLGQFATLDGTASTGNINTYNWAPTANVNDPSAATTTIQPLSTTTYVLTVADTLGCTSLDSVLVEVGRCIPHHAGFTPNGDGVNDFWEIPCLNLFTNRVQVFNRWGLPVFETVNYDGTWNGRNLGQDVPDGTYYYVISVDEPQLSEPKIYKGTVTIIR
ncbi:gliding motility-associated C-terminal domain-containing protein [Aureispira sp. CCB-QB1]|uniref:gliding motility-associated C-terminal domain-containing protein n=1 Tax=Aureispira sp. CCB-QB1 TaxID=1313421 RepID=UPI000698799E|nr:gliding motility-associated C-terminal domain-containing protein [Aureispira sp. CCB-QB1]